MARRRSWNFGERPEMMVAKEKKTLWWAARVVSARNWEKEKGKQTFLYLHCRFRTSPKRV
jgi:hypothetical protein